MLNNRSVFMLTMIGFSVHISLNLFFQFRAGILASMIKVKLVSIDDIGSHL